MTIFSGGGGFYMKRLVIEFLEKGAMACLAGILLVGFIVGYAAGDFGAALLGLILAFVLAVPVFGVLFLLLEMNDSLRAMRKAAEGRQQ
jgi:hypothetical protein